MNGENMVTVGSDEEMLPLKEPTPSITKIVTILDVMIPRSRRKAKLIVNYIKSIILMSETYI